MRQHAKAVGLSDAVIVNTCAVTTDAVRQSAKTVRKARRDYPSARIIVTGCAAQIEPSRFADIPGVDHVVGNGDKLKVETFARIADATLPAIHVADIMSVRETAPHMVDSFAQHTRAFVQVQNGCDHRCTFCIIPFGRGPSRSVPAGAVISQIRSLVEAGVGEVVLTGVDMTSYGPDLPGAMTLGRLVRQILRHVPGLKRLRISSIDQVEADSELLDAIATEPRLMPHLHLSLQSGDDMMLKRMKRRHSRADAIRFCENLRARRPDVVFGADLIAGFPTETDRMFDNSRTIIEACGLTYVHVFPFSPRHGTPAAKMPQHHPDLIRHRAGILRDEAALSRKRFFDAQTGRTVDVLMERGGIGRTPQFAEVIVGGNVQAGVFAKVRVTSHNGKRLIGEATQ